jgi:hypothetical protein
MDHRGRELMTPERGLVIGILAVVFVIIIVLAFKLLT